MADDTDLLKAQLEANFDALLRVRALLLPFREEHIDVQGILNTIDAYLDTMLSDWKGSVSGPATMGQVSIVVRRLVQTAMTRGGPALQRLKTVGQSVGNRIKVLLGKLRGTPGGAGTGRLAQLVGTVATAAAICSIFYMAGEVIRKTGTAAKETGKGALLFGIGAAVVLLVLVFAKGARAR